jgi:hypothetical protein
MIPVNHEMLGYNETYVFHSSSYKIFNLINFRSCWRKLDKIIFERWSRAHLLDYTITIKTNLMSTIQTSIFICFVAGIL